MATDRATVPWGRPALRAILACTLALPLGVSLLSPALPIIRESFAITDARTSLVITLYFLPGVVVAPAIGLAADRVGRRRVLLPSLVAFGLLGAAIAGVDTFAFVLALRFLQGVAATGVFILTVTYITDLFEGLQRNAVLGVNAAVLFGGAALFPFAGGALAAIDWHVPFLTYLAVLPIAGYVFLRLEDPLVEKPRCGPGYLHGAASALPFREALALYGATFILETTAFGAVLTALPFLVRSEFEASPVLIGGTITAMFLVAMVVSAANGRIARRRSNHWLIAATFCVYAIGLLGLWVADTLPIVFVSASVMGVGFGMTLPSIDAAIAKLAPQEFRAGAISIRTATAFLGRTAGPIVFTGIAIQTGYRPLLFAVGIGSLFVGVAGLLVVDSEPTLLADPATR